MRTRHEIVDRARLHVGHRETSNNRSPLIDAWLRRCGLGPGYAWCAAFASWCIEERQYGVNAISSGLPGPVRQAGALKLGAEFPETDAPQPGDLMWFATGGGKGHVGIVVAVSPMEVLCVEGNSANQVRYVRRLRSEVHFSRTRLETWKGDMVGDIGPWALAPLAHPAVEGTR